MSLTDAQINAAAKYSHDGKFSEPLVRCDSCAKLIFTRDLSKSGMCSCGNMRVRNVRTLRIDDDVDELEQVRKWVKEGKVDSDWLDLWVEK
ncbi:hypothetical protein LCGC14_1179410 [marine sediment metagenome]|uniref:Uncharacterized protein n=1 Tax=marine sediment metagenome TaxID=412755 RepID=A0A0F9P5L0_9ZZZZ